LQILLLAQQSAIKTSVASSWHFISTYTLYYFKQHKSNIMYKRDIYFCWYIILNTMNKIGKITIKIIIIQFAYTVVVVLVVVLVAVAAAAAAAAVVVVVVVVLLLTKITQLY